MKKIFRSLIIAIEFILSAGIVYSIGYVVYTIYKNPIERFLNDVQLYIRDNRLELGIALLCVSVVLIMNEIMMKISGIRRRKQRREAARLYFHKRIAQQKKEEKEQKVLSKNVRKSIKLENSGDGWSQFIDASRKGFL